MLEDILSAVEARLQMRGVMYAQSGGAVRVNDGFTLDSNVKRGLTKGLGRMFSGESLFMAIYTTSRSDSIIAFASTAPGKILAVDVAKINPICQKGAFLCAQTTVGINIVLIKKFTAGFLGGGGFTLRQIQGSGMTFLEMDGDVVERALAPGEVIEADTENIFVFELSVSYEVETMEGMRDILFGSEGLLLTKLTGPGKVYMQTMNTTELTGQITRGLPTSK